MVEAKVGTHSCYSPWLVCAILFQSNELENHGSDAYCEIVCRTIQKVYQLSQQSGRPFPQHLALQSDNTTAQAKNQYAFTFLAYLVCTFKFITCTINFLMVGHTHEDIDQLFALVLWLLVRKSGFETPLEILSFLKRELQSHIEAKGSVLEAVQLTAVHNFATWLWPLGLALSGAFLTRQGIEAPHSFAFKFGSCLCADERASEGGASGGCGFVLLRENVHARHKVAAATCVVHHARASIQSYSSLSSTSRFGES